MNPFTTPDRLFISRRPQDMRAGIQRLASKVAADFGMDPTDGSLYCFVSRDCEKMKMLRFDVNGWCMYYVRLAEGGKRQNHRAAKQENSWRCLESSGSFLVFARNAPRVLRAAAAIL